MLFSLPLVRLRNTPPNVSRGSGCSACRSLLVLLRIRGGALGTSAALVRRAAAEQVGAGRPATRGDAANESWPRFWFLGGEEREFG